MGGKQSFAASAMTLALVIIVVGAAACAASASLTGYTFVLDDEGLQAHNPQAEAQATRVALAALDEARAREIERQAAQAEADATTAAQPALVARNVMLALGIGIGGLVLAIGLAFAAVAWVSRRATSIYPNAAGQYPVIVRRGFGWVTFHDPNRALGPAAVYRVPTILDVAANAVATLKGQAAPRLAVAADFPPTASEPTMAQIASQAQAGQVAAAQNRWPKSPLLAGRVTTGNLGDNFAPPAIEPAARMPTIRVIDDKAEADKLLLLFEGEG